METFSERLQHVMDSKKLPRKYIIKNTRFDSQQLSRWLRGEVIPRRTTIAELARVVGCNLKWLADGTEESYPPQKSEKIKTGEIAATLGHWKTSQKHPEETGETAAAGEINLSEGVSMTETVLLSNTSYADALWANLKSFAKAVETERDMNELKNDMREMERKMAAKMERMEELLLSLGATTNEKKDKEANS